MRAMRVPQNLPRKLLAAAIPLAGAALLLRPGVLLRAAPAPADSPKVVTYQSGAAQWLSAPRSIQLSEGVTFGQDDATLKTDAAVALLDKNQNLVSAQAAGPVHIVNPQNDLQGQHGTIDFTRHLAKLTGRIVLVVKPGPGEASAPEGSPRRQFKDPATLTCSEMTYDYRRKIGRVPGPLKVVQVVQTKDGPETRTLTAEGGLYDGKAQTIQLVGTIAGQYSDGSHILGDTRTVGKPVVIGIKEGAEYVKAPFVTKGVFTVKNQPETPDDNADEADLSLPTPPPAPAKSAATPAAPPAVPGNTVKP